MDRPSSAKKSKAIWSGKGQAVSLVPQSLAYSTVSILMGKDHHYPIL